MDSLFESTNGLQLDYIVSYSQLLINEQYDNKILFLSTLGEDTKLLENGTLISLNEGVISAVFEFLTKIIKAITATIERFVQDITKLIGQDSKFLAKYEDTIKRGKTVKVGDKWEECYGYEKAIAAIKPNGLLSFQKKDFATIEQNVDKWQTVPGFVSDVHLAGLQSYDEKENITLKNKIISQLVGSAHTILDTQVTNDVRQRMFEYCYKGYNDAIDSLNRDKDLLKESAREIENKLNEVKNKAIEEEKKAEQNNPTNGVEGHTPETAQGADNAKGAEKAQGANEATTYESTTLKYFTEEKLVKAEVDNNGNNTNNTNGEEEKEKDKWAKLSAAIKSYTNANTTMLSAKMKIGIDAYRFYMKLMRWYVGRVKGTEDANPTIDEKDKNAKVEGI